VQASSIALDAAMDHDVDNDMHPTDSGRADEAF